MWSFLAILVPWLDKHMLYVEDVLLTNCGFLEGCVAVSTTEGACLSTTYSPTLWMHGADVVHSPWTEIYSKKNANLLRKITLHCWHGTYWVWKANWFYTLHIYCHGHLPHRHYDQRWCRRSFDDSYTVCSSQLHLTSTRVTHSRSAIIPTTERHNARWWNIAHEKEYHINRPFQTTHTHKVQLTQQ